MIVQSIDLAARFSASCVLGPGGSAVIEECGSLGLDGLALTQTKFIDRVLRVFERSWPDFLVVEDVPHQMRFDSGTKNTCRLQGALMERLGAKLGTAQLSKVLMVPPALWQRHFTGVWRAGEVGAATCAREQYGYEPPDLHELYKALYADLHYKERQDVRSGLKKQVTDYVDAFLMAKWAQEIYVKQGNLDVKSAQWYLPRTA